MNRFKRNLLTAMLMAAFSLPALSDATPSAPPAATPDAAAAADPADRNKLIQGMRARMYEMMHTQDADKRHELMEAQLKDMDALMEMGPPGPGMGMGMMMGRGMGPGPMAMGPGGMGNCGMGPGAGMGGMGPGVGKPCLPGYGGNCRTRGAGFDQRLDALEKRMDMMQMMLEQMTRN